MKTSIKLCGLAAAVLMATAGSAMASDTVIPYVLDSQNKVVTNSTGLCWRTSFWTPALAEQGGPDGYGCTCAADTLFAFDSDKLSADGRNMLDQLVSRMAGMDVEVILTTGYADRLGKDAYNQQLSERRAESVKTYLTEKGVDSGLIQTEGRGAADPVVNCPKPAAGSQIRNMQDLIKCLAPNRRAVIEVIGTRTVQ